jgi:hypothetical protein
MALLGLLTLVVLPGLVQLLSKLWGGTGSFEQMVNTLTFAVVVPTIVIRQTAEILFGVPVNLITGQQRWWTAAMGGELGPVVEAVWNTFVIGVYTIGFDVWVPHPRHDRDTASPADPTVVGSPHHDRVLRAVDVRDRGHIRALIVVPSGPRSHADKSELKAILRVAKGPTDRIQTTLPPRSALEPSWM